MPDQVVKTTLVVNANASGMKSIGEALDELISKAKELNDLLGGIKVGGGEGAGAGGKGGKGGASGGSSWDQPQPGGEGEGGADSGGGGKGRKRRRKGGASGGSTGEGDGGGDSGDDDDGLTDGEKRAKKNRQRLGYAAAVGVGMLARSVKSHYTAYYEGMYGAQATEAAGAYSGDIYQQAIAYRQAQAQREQSQLRHASGWAALNIASGAAGMAGSGIMMLPGLIPKLVGGAVTALGMFGGMAAGQQIATQGAEIDVETAKQNAAINTASRMQDSTMQLLTAQRDVIAFGARNTNQFSEAIDYGATLGYTPYETQAMANRYLTAGGHMYPGFDGVRRPRHDFLWYRQNFGISPETTGAFEATFDPGGGALPEYKTSYTSSWGQTFSSTVPNTAGEVARDALNAAINAARSVGVPQARMDEWVARNTQYLRAGAERNVNIAPFSFTDTMNYLPTSVQGFARAAGAENMRNTGMGMADDLGNMMMPQDLARGLMMANIVGKGGGPADWQKQMTDPNAVAGNISDLYNQMPDMLKPFFLQSTTGLIGVEDFGKGKGGTTSTEYPKGVATEEASDIRDVTAKFAAQQKLYIQSIADATKYLEKFNDAILSAILNVEVYKDVVFSRTP